MEISEETVGKRVAVNLVYLVIGACWKASYDVHVDKERSKVIMTYYGEVVNSTGEHWREISMSLSTARPSIGRLASNSRK